MKLQADGFKKRGSVKAETSLSAVEMSGKVMKRGYLLKQVTPSRLRPKGAGEGLGVRIGVRVRG